MARCKGYSRLRRLACSATAAAQQYPPHTSRLKTVRRTVFSTPLTLSGFESLENKKRTEATPAVLLLFLARCKGFEPLTFWFVAKHSIQLSYERSKRWWLRAESNHRHEDFQSSALPTELRSQKKMAVSTRFELAIFCVTGRRDNHYTTRPIWLRETDLNHRPSGYEPNELPNCSIPR